MATFSVMIENKDNGEYALNFVDALLSEGHELNIAFCFKDGIYAPINAKGFLRTSWQELVQRHKITLSLCSASVARAGLENSIIQNKHLELVGLTSFVATSMHADKCIQF